MTMSPEMRQLIGAGELWDAGTPNSPFRGRINNSRLLSQIGSATVSTGKLGNAYTFPASTGSDLQSARDNALWMPSSGTLSFWWNIDFASNSGWGAANGVTAIVFDGNGLIVIRRDGGAAARIQLRNQQSSGSSTSHLSPNGSFPAVAGSYHIVMQWVTGGSVVFWINGIKHITAGTFQGFDTAVGFPNIRISTVSIAADHKIEQVALFPGQVISDANVLHLYNSGNGREWGVHRAIPEDFLSTQIG